MKRPVHNIVQAYRDASNPTYWAGEITKFQRRLKAIVKPTKPFKEQEKEYIDQ